MEKYAEEYKKSLSHPEEFWDEVAKLAGVITSLDITKGDRVLTLYANDFSRRDGDAGLRTHWREIGPVGCV